jgi:uncharacterized iron-regulated membrane protein
MRRLAARAHLWGGLLLGPLVLVLGLSGAALVFREELDDALGGPHAIRSAGAPRPLDAVVAAALFTEPGGEAHALRIPAAHEKPYRVEVAHGARRVDVAVDPVTLRVLDSRAPERSVLAAVRSLHAGFHAGRPGALAVALIGVALVLESGSGLFLYGPRLWRRPHRSRGSRGRSRYLHRVLGGVSLALGLVLGITGVVLALAGAVAAAAPSPPAGGLSGLDGLAARARAAAPGATLGALVAVDGVVRAEMRGPRPVTVLLERESGRVVGVQGLPAGGAWDVVRRLHYGDFAGWLSRALWALGGVALAALSITGYVAATRPRGSS